MAEGQDRSASGDRDGFEHEHLDTRFSHNHSYHDQGYTLNHVPRGGYSVDRDQTHYWYNRGEWYRREASDWIVV